MGSLGTCLSRQVAERLVNFAGTCGLQDPAHRTLTKRALGTGTSSVVALCFVSCRVPERLQLSLQTAPPAPGAHAVPAVWAAPTFLFVRGFSVSGPPTPRQAEGALAGEAGAAGIEGSRDPTLLLPPLFPLQAGSKRTAHGVAQPLALREAGEGRGGELETLRCAPWTPGALGPSSQGLGDQGQSLCLSDLSEHLPRGTQMTALSENKKPATRVRDCGDSSKN